MTFCLMPLLGRSSRGRLRSLRIFESGNMERTRGYSPLRYALPGKNEAWIKRSLGTFGNLDVKKENRLQRLQLVLTGSSPGSESFRVYTCTARKLLMWY